MGITLVFQGVPVRGPYRHISDEVAETYCTGRWSTWLKSYCRSPPRCRSPSPSPPPCRSCWAPACARDRDCWRSRCWSAPTRRRRPGRSSCYRTRRSASSRPSPAACRRPPRCCWSWPSPTTPTPTRAISAATARTRDATMTSASSSMTSLGCCCSSAHAYLRSTSHPQRTLQ